MLSNLSSYLFGSYENDNITQNASEPPPVEFNEVEEEDWMLIDACSKKQNENAENDLILSEEVYGITRASSPDLQDSRSRQRSNSFKEMIHQRRNKGVALLRELSPSDLNVSMCNVALSSAAVTSSIKSRSPSRSSSQCFMEESWFVTPPPCFVSEPYDTRPSSLENLLIEQPGMNFPIYLSNGVATAGLVIDTVGEIVLRETTRKGTAPTALVKSKKSQGKKVPKNSPISVQPILDRGQMSSSVKRSASAIVEQNATATAVAQPDQQTALSPSSSSLADKDDKRKQLIEARDEKRLLHAYRSELNSVQKSEQKLATQFLKRNHLDKQNKVLFELSSRKKRQRRADMTKRQHSGANNDRKCCY